MTLTPDMLLKAYANGYFPMAMGQDDPELYWFSPEERGVLPLDRFHIPRGLKRALKQHPYTLSVDRDFVGVITACADMRSDTREDSWINDEIIRLYTALHEQGDAHSVEVWQDAALVGVLYGVSLGGAFFGESMFSKQPNASKIALVTLVEILNEAGYELLDTQYVNAHLKQFGIEEIAKADYMTKLAKALNASPNPSTRFSTASVRKGLASSSSASLT